MAEIMTDPFTTNGEFFYPAEDAQQILRLAIARKTESGELSRAQLLEIAEELGISPNTLAEAEQEWAMKRYEVADRRMFDRQCKQQFQSDVVQFALWLVGIAVLHLLLGAFPFVYLAYFILGVRALNLVWIAWWISHPESHGYQQEFQAWRRKQQMKRAVGGFMRRFLRFH